MERIARRKPQKAALRQQLRLFVREAARPTSKKLESEQKKCGAATFTLSRVGAAPQLNNQHLAN
jgi:hypothetical protein